MKKKISKKTNSKLQNLKNQARQLHQQKKWDDCIALWTKCISLEDDPHGQSVSYRNRGVAYGNKGKHDLAIEDFNKAIGLNINNANAYLGRGVAYGNKGKHDLAFMDILRAVEEKKNLKSRNSWAYLVARIKDIIKDDEKGVEPFGLFITLHAAIAKIKEVRLSKPIDGNEIAHYTSLHTLKKLVDKEECFRLYNAGYMNDPEEGRAFFDVMEYFFNIAGKGERWRDVKSLFYLKNKETPYPSSAYIGSFVIVDSDVASAKNKDELFLWRTYGKHDLEEAAGACLIFKHEETHFAEHPPFEISAMSQLVDTGPMSWQQPPKPALYKIAYLSCCNKGQLAIALGELVKPLEAVVSFYKEFEGNQKVALAKLVRELLDDIRFLFKADHYKEEHEVRVIRMAYYAAEQTDIQIDMEQFPPSLYLETLKGCRFPEVILGPQTRRVSEWKQWLKKRGVEKVSPSGIPYRTQ